MGLLKSKMRINSIARGMAAISILLAYLPMLTLTAQVKKIEFERFSSEADAALTDAICMIQDSRGFLWIGTSDGLFRFDGHKFKVYRHDLNNPHSLGQDWIRSLYLDRDKELWVVTENRGLDRFDPPKEAFLHYRHDPDDANSLSSNDISAIAVDQSGIFWIGHKDKGLDKFDKHQNLYEHVKNDPENANSLSSNLVRSLCVDHNGLLWVGTESSGLNLFNPDAGVWQCYKNNPKDSTSLSHNTVQAIIEDRSGVIWIGTQYGLNQINPKTQKIMRLLVNKQYFKDPYAISQDFVLFLFQDRTDMLWVSTLFGLYAYDLSKEFLNDFSIYPKTKALLIDGTSGPVIEDRSGIIWTISENKGLYKYNRKNRKFAHYKNEPGNPNSLSNNQVAALCVDHTGDAWIGTLTEGLWTAWSCTTIWNIPPAICRIPAYALFVLTGEKAT